MTVCNMSIEGGARCGYVNPDEKTVEYLRGRRYTPDDEGFADRARGWLAMASEPGCAYDDVVTLDGAEIEPSITWGIHPGHNLGVSERIPTPNGVADDERGRCRRSARVHGFRARRLDRRHADRRRVHRLLHERSHLGPARGRQDRPDRQGAGRGPRTRRAGSMAVRKEAEAEGLHEIFRAAGFQWREPGCSMCLAMNPDKLKGREVCASSSNRNFKGRQGSPSGRTLLMSPAMVAAAAIAAKSSTFERSSAPRAKRAPLGQGPPARRRPAAGRQTERTR